MKKSLSVLLAVVLMFGALSAMASAQENSFGGYDRVVILGVDGAGAFFSKTDTPNVDAIFANGATTEKCRTEFPSISAQCWGAMLLGVTQDRHKLTNDIVGEVERSSSEKYPSVFRTIRENDSNATLASFSCWNPINFGIIENDISVYKDSASDDVMTEKIVDYLKSNDPKLLFVQFDSVDGAGHNSGYGKAEHLRQVTVVDGYIGKIYETLGELGRLESTLFIVSADHGGTIAGGHGGATPKEMNIFLGVKGKNVVNGTIGSVEVRDIAAITLHALGLSQPEIWTARVPSNLFADYTAQPRPLGDSVKKQFIDFGKDTKAWYETNGAATENLLQTLLPAQADILIKVMQAIVFIFSSFELLEKI